MSITFISNNITKLLDVSGSVIMPLIGFMIPILLVHWKAYFVDGTRKNCKKILNTHPFSLFENHGKVGFSTEKSLFGKNPKYRKKIKKWNFLEKFRTSSLKNIKRCSCRTRILKLVLDRFR